LDTALRRQVTDSSITDVHRWPTLISTKEDLKFFIRADLAASRLPAWRPYFAVTHRIAHFQRLLRRTEYWDRCRSDPVGRLVSAWLRLRCQRLGERFGYEIPRYAFGPGLSVAHFGTVTVNPDARIGRNCRLHSCTIGEVLGESPVIGDNVHIGPGARILGGITVGDRVVVAANAVVVKDVPEGVTVGGVPARVLNSKDSADLVVDGCSIAAKELA
jgi:serine O-acetyltransferase